MKNLLFNLRRTTNSKYVGIIRIFIGGLILMTGVMKIAIPSLREAFWLQLTLSELPFPKLSLYLVPILEVVTGVLLLIGSYSRPVSLVVMGIMSVATYVHLVVTDPRAFPLQSTAPIMPILVFLLSTIVLWRGGGAWSRDLKVNRTDK